MAIFKKKEKKEDSHKLPELPKMEFPSYEPQIETIENKKNDFKPSRYKIEEEPEERGYEREMIPRRKMDVVGDKPLFIKMDKYKDAINDIENIKKRIREAEGILGELERIKAEEDKEIESWKVEIERIKNKLMDVDRKLFEDM